MRLAKHTSGCLSNVPFGQGRVEASLAQRDLAGTKKVGNPKGDRALPCPLPQAPCRELTGQGAQGR